LKQQIYSESALDGRANSAQGSCQSRNEINGPEGLIMMTLSIGKTMAPALLVGTASVAALVYAFTQVPGGSKVESGAIGVMSQPPQPEPGKPASAAISADKSSSNAEAAPALASTQNKVAALSAELGASPPAPAADPSLPAFDIARIESGGDAVIAGRAAPGATVDLMHNGERLDRAVADASGQFVMVPPHLPAGNYELTLSAKLPDGTVALSKQGVAVTVKEADASTGAIAPRAETAPQPAAAVARIQDKAPDKPQTKTQDTATTAPRRAMAAASASDDGASATRGGTTSGSTRIVSRGDSLWRISRVTYGAGEQYAILYRANRDRIKDPNLIHPCQVLVLPLKGR
jgi:nucleoid-associated protein YgaU